MFFFGNRERPQPPSARPCEDCGLVTWGEHFCDPQRVIEHTVRNELPSFNVFDTAFRTWLDTPSGKFAQYEAARTR